jgi:hypothetical protein
LLSCLHGFYSCRRCMVAINTTTVYHLNFMLLMVINVFDDGELMMDVAGDL